eukprot:SAG11_NODE_2648_length_3128_cov_1.284252_5_plen_37_part_00
MVIGDGVEISGERLGDIALESEESADVESALVRNMR